MKSQSGFTLIEMVAVIIILAIMAATALPRFSNLSSDARLSSINGLAGGLRSASALAKAKWLAAQSGALDTVDMGGTNVSVININTAGSGVATLGYPLGDANGTGIDLALDNFSGYTSGSQSDGGVYYWPNGVTTSSTCYAWYRSGTVTVVAANAAACG